MDLPVLSRFFILLAPLFVAGPLAYMLVSLLVWTDTILYKTLNHWAR